MEINKILSADVLDIIFEGRNKDYGAYQLRKTYNKRLMTALICNSVYHRCFRLAAICCQTVSSTGRRQERNGCAGRAVGGDQTGRTEGRAASSAATQTTRTSQSGNG